MAVNIGASWYGLTANQHSDEGATDVPGASASHGFVGTIPIAPGTYSACVWVTEPSGPAVNTGCHTVVVPVPAQTTYGLDSITGSTAGVSVAGWAQYPDSPASSVGIALNIGAAWYGFTANQANSDAGAGTNHGYSGSVALAPGTYNVCVWVTEPSGPALNTGCHTVVVTAPARTTTGLDSLTGTTTGVSVAGWAVFPDSPATSVGIALNIGSGWYGFTANQANSDVGAGTNHGYTGSVPLAPGTYSVCIWVTEPTGPAVNTGCQSVTVLQPPRTVAVIDSIHGSGAGVTVNGYAVYPGALSASVGVAVNIGSGWYGLTANQPSSEAALAYPTSTVGHGFTGTIPIAPGTYTACIWVTEPTGSAVQVGCQSVTVTPPRPAVYGLDSEAQRSWSVSSGSSIFATGYAVWPDSDATNVPIALQIDSNWYPFVAHEANTTGSDEAQAAVPGVGPNHGFDVGAGTYPPGSYHVCLWVAEPSGGAVNAGCSTVVVQPRIPAVVSVPSITASSAGVSVSGYAIYPDSVDWGVGVAVNIGSNWYPFTANQLNVAGSVAVPTSHTYNGYAGLVPEPPGTYNACVWVAEPAGGAINTGCASVTVP